MLSNILIVLFFFKLTILTLLLRPGGLHFLSIKQNVLATHEYLKLKESWTISEIKKKWLDKSKSMPNCVLLHTTKAQAPLVGIRGHWSLMPPFAFVWSASSVVLFHRGKNLEMDKAATGEGNLYAPDDTLHRLLLILYTDCWTNQQKKHCDRPEKSS